MTREEAKRVLEFDLDHTYNDESKEALRMAIEALEQKMGWIPVSDGLPENSGNYLVSYNCYSEDITQVGVAWFAHKKDYKNMTESGFGIISRDSEVIAWMPLPKPYKI